MAMNRRFPFVYLGVIVLISSLITDSSADETDVAPTPKTLWDNALSILDYEHYQDDFNSPEFCHQRVVGKNNYDKPIKNHFNSRFKYGLTTAAVLKCVMVTDLITTPYSIVQQLTRAFNEMDWKRHGWQSAKLLLKLPYILIKGIVLAPIKTLVRLAGIVFGSMVTFADAEF